VPQLQGTEFNQIKTKQTKQFNKTTALAIVNEPQLPRFTGP
jgi:hypothetical protein